MLHLYYSKCLKTMYLVYFYIFLTRLIDNVNILEQNKQKYTCAKSYNAVLVKTKAI